MGHPVKQIDVQSKFILLEMTNPVDCSVHVLQNNVIFVVLHTDVGYN